jgi:hypothetical protein
MLTRLDGFELPRDSPSSKSQAQRSSPVLSRITRAMHRASPRHANIAIYHATPFEVAAQSYLKYFAISLLSAGRAPACSTE